ncbi:hypothetical protein [Enterococcus gallinarum]|uniref:hypothetical protein n=1 Tax=Enterococcus gallinarum TaxID=1353 RepID=UPI00214CE65C|nr:hypothetical protein [Enterococcus gallinarum]MCR1932854.1 hypothetical protein [Enterococcus gallinarum]
MNVSELIKRLKEERIQGSSAVLNYSNFDYWVHWDDIVEIVEDHDQPQLNENQQVVLDWLKNRYTGNADPFGVAACLFSQTPRSEVIVATLKLTRDEQAQVLKIFANWALEQEEE